ncbi:MAG: 50S ribosomal protein L18 [Syntrophomonadaceae bacterium]|nr:50S ribosomal protein L18 [Bacillota bacterium]NLM89289.1 50S ribosomal protein L18 [Syntrophomonadaceae bacterium]HAA08692.1 50S ribosomal protein L18 [Syntrophomonas sp.]HQA49513.1 50S ribosomal protein L18 [Syntrophomonadaceae bacterium]HQD90466.1 50S ribosomal protein L18 [Syntrophomonadaceae bacterium]
MIKKPSRNQLRQNKHKRVRRRVIGTGEIPRLCVYKSLNHIYAQIIDDEKGVTLAAASTLDKELSDLPSKNNIEAAKEVGSRIAAKAQEKGITTVVFDRSGYKYHGRVAALADAAREKGLQF